MEDSALTGLAGGRPARHLAADAEPVTAVDCPDVADRAASDLPSELEDLGHRQDRSFGCVLGSCTADLARVGGGACRHLPQL